MKQIRKAARGLQQNKGITLVELLVVIAILSIMVGAAGISISLLFSRDAESCAKTVDTMLETSRMRALSKEGKHTFMLDTEKKECSVLTDGKTEALPSRVTLSLSSVGTYDFSSNTVLEVDFDKSTGRVLGLKADSVPISVDDVNLIRMQAENQSGKKATVVLVVATGKHFIEYGT